MTEAYNPFVQIGKSFEGFAHSGVYYKLRRQSTGSKLLCALIVTLLLNLITFGISAVKLCSDKDLQKFVDEMPNFTYSNGTFSLDDRYETSTDSSYILIDTKVSYYYSGNDSGGYINPVNIDTMVSELAKKGGMQQAMFISESNIVVVNFMTSQVQQMKFSELSAVMNIPSFSKASIQGGYKNFIIKWAVILGLIWIPFQFAGLFIAGLIYGLLAQIIKGLAKSTADFSTTYWISFYIVIAFTIIKTLIRNTMPLSGSMINTIFFALFFILMLKTLKDGDPDANQAYENTYLNAMAGNPQAGTSPYVSNPSGSGVIKDDFDAFMAEGNQAGSNTPTGDSIPFSGGSSQPQSSNPWDAPTNNQTANTGGSDNGSGSSSSGLSLKK